MLNLKALLYMSLLLWCESCLHQLCKTRKHCCLCLYFFDVNVVCITCVTHCCHCLHFFDVKIVCIISVKQDGTALYVSTSLIHNLSASLVIYMKALLIKDMMMRMQLQKKNQKNPHSPKIKQKQQQSPWRWQIILFASNNALPQNHSSKVYMIKK